MLTATNKPRQARLRRRAVC